MLMLRQGDHSPMQHQFIAPVRPRMQTESLTRDASDPKGQPVLFALKAHIGVELIQVWSQSLVGNLPTLLMSLR